MLTCRVVLPVISILVLILSACIPIDQAVMGLEAEIILASEGEQMIYQLDDLTMHYEVYGEGQPVLLLHGRPNDHNVMVTAFEPIFSQQDGWKRIYVDLPGMGQTTGGSWLQSDQDVLDVLIQFMDERFPDERFVLVGFSYGGYLARGMLHKRHELIDGMMLLAPNVTGNHEERIVAQHRVIVSNLEGLAKFPPPFNEFLNTILVVQDDDVLALQDDIIVGFQNADQEMLDRISQKPEFDFAVDELSSPFEKPVLIITGKFDSVVGYEQAGDLLLHYPRATYAVLDRSGHGVHMEQQAMFRLMVKEWLDRIKEEKTTR